jgi:hypothetical protein
MAGLSEPPIGAGRRQHPGAARCAIAHTRRGFDWTSRYPAIVRTALALPARSCTLDGESVVCGGDGVAVFADLHRRGVVTEAMLYAFDLLEFGGEDLRPFPLSDRKRLLAKVVGRRSLGIVLSQHTDEDIFQGVCRMGLEGYCFEAALFALPIGSVNGLAEDQESGEPSDGATERGALVRRAAFHARNEIQVRRNQDETRHR